jgi:hypothetical protein
LGETFCRKSPPSPLQRLLVFTYSRYPKLGASGINIKNFWREFERNFLQKGSLKAASHAGY